MDTNGFQQNRWHFIHTIIIYHDFIWQTQEKTDNLDKNKLIGESIWADRLLHGLRYTRVLPENCDGLFKKDIIRGNINFHGIGNQINIIQQITNTIVHEKRYREVQCGKLFTDDIEDQNQK